MSWVRPPIHCSRVDVTGYRLPSRGTGFDFLIASLIDRWAALSWSVFVLKIQIKPAFVILLYEAFLSSLSWPSVTCVIV